MKLGILLPTSKLYPSLMIDFSAGIRMAIAEFQLENEVELIFESIHQGTDKNLLLNAANKLVLQHQVDVNILFGNPDLLEDIATSLNALQRPTILTNMGANIPKLFDPGDFIFSNSFGLWESAYLAARWGADKFGKKVAHGSYFYEAGYGMYSAFFDSLINSGGEVIFNQISEFNPNPDDFQNFMKQMTVEPADFLYMLYSERDAVDFLNKLAKSEENGKYPVISSGVLLNDEILEKVEGLPENILNVASWDLSDETDENSKFKEEYKNQTGNDPNYFALLGYECAGTIFSSMKQDGWSKNGKDQAEAIKNSAFSGPRGPLSYNNPINSTSFESHVYKLDSSKKRVRIDSIGKMQDREDFIETSKEKHNPAGWFQPYLCQ